MKILLVEDDPEVADYVRQGLQEERHQVATVADGREGLFRATGEDWDLFIVDRMLPKLDGLALVRTLRAASIGTPDKQGPQNGKITVSGYGTLATSVSLPRHEQTNKRDFPCNSLTSKQT